MLRGTFDPVSNKAGWEYILEVLDDETEEPLDLSDCVIVFEIREPSSLSTILSATVANGKITLPETGIFQVNFTATDMRTLCAKIYEIGCTITNGDEEPEQFIIGKLPILDGVVT